MNNMEFKEVGGFGMLVKKEKYKVLKVILGSIIFALAVWLIASEIIIAP